MARNSDFGNFDPITKDDITKEMFDSYRRVQMGGKYNMIMDAEKARRDANLGMDEYMMIIKNYSEFSKKFA